VCISVSDLVKYSDGKCSAWSRFFRETIKAHGITNATFKAIRPFATNHQPYRLYVKEQNILPVLFDPSNPPIPLFGVAGQGNDDPLSVFSDHAVVACSGVIYDPSYGNSFNDLYAWQRGSLAVVAFDGGSLHIVVPNSASGTNLVEYYYSEP
jgi:hypothetical protein